MKKEHFMGKSMGWTDRELSAEEMHFPEGARFMEEDGSRPGQHHPRSAGTIHRRERQIFQKSPGCQRAAPEKSHPLLQSLPFQKMPHVLPGKFSGYGIPDCPGAYRRDQRQLVPDRPGPAKSPGRTEKAGNTVHTGTHPGIYGNFESFLHTMRRHCLRRRCC